MIDENFYNERNKRLYIHGLRKKTNGIYPERTQASLKTYKIIRGDLKEKITRGYFISGGIGVGKTSLLVLAADMLLAARYSVEYITTSEYIELYKRSNRFFTNVDTFEKIDGLRNIEYLLLDNFGWSLLNETALNIITELLRYRYDNSKPTIICSNININEMLSGAEVIKEEFRDYYRQIADYLNDPKSYRILKIGNNKSLRGEVDSSNFDIEDSLLSELGFYKVEVEKLTL